MILVVFHFVKVRQRDFGGVAMSFLGVLTGNRHIHALHPPPVGETLTVVQTRVAAFAIFVAINLAIFSLGHMYLQGVTFNGKRVIQVVPIAGTIFVLHPVPIGAFLAVGTSLDGSVSMQINGRLTVQTASAIVRIVDRIGCTVLAVVSR